MMQFSQEIINIMDHFGQQFGMAIDWTNENIVPYLQQLFERFIIWQICDSAMWMVMMASLTLVSFGILKKVCSKYPDLDELGVFWVFWFVLLIVSMLIIIGNAFYIVQCITFPEKVLFDYIQCQMSSS